MVTTSAIENVGDDNNVFNYTSREFRLPRTLFPHFYDLSIQVHLHGNKSQAFFFNGSVTINVFCSVSTTEFFVHASDNLNVSLNQIHMSRLHEKNQTSSIIEIDDVSYFQDAECYRIKLKTPLQPHTYYNLTFGQFRSDMDYDSDGLYISRYLENGIYKHLASTDLEPSDARSIFPCWDEPEFKAKFKFTVWARPDKIRSAEYSLDIGIKLLGYFEDYFGIPYSLPKMGRYFTQMCSRLIYV
ncbi:unnamed protein product [Schistosoma margrebowiei]|uniref:Uncharacterized protein n=1 Tax=Schistosoma margrebowiei TaxID=48269 RepID=A0A183M1J2_9TREM|nr:unnamed protein product [Schistosoma margrebowiei]